MCLVRQRLKSRNKGCLWVVTPILRKIRKKLANKVHRLARLGVRLINSTEEGVVVINAYEASLLSQIKGEKDQDPILLELMEKVHKQ